MNPKRDIGLQKQDFELAMLNLQVLDAMDDWVRVIDRDGGVLFQNESMKASCALEDDIRCSFEDNVLVGKGICPKSVSSMTFLTKKTFNKEILFLDREFSVKSSPIMDEEMSVVAAVEVFRDISIETHIRRELFNANRRMTDDIKFARKIQSQLLPERGRFGDLDIDYYYEPSEHLSGDLFDIIDIDGDQTGIYICDAVGHGVTASMMTMFIKQTMRAIITELGSDAGPSTVLYEIRSRFGEMKLAENLYFTIFYGIYDKRSRQFTYSNAGHTCQPILLSGDSHSILDLSGVPICDLFKDMPYREKAIELKIGDKLVFYTDGFTETKDYNREEFGIQRFIDALEEGREDPIFSVLAEVTNFRWGEIVDDMAIMVATIKK